MYQRGGEGVGDGRKGRTGKKPGGGTFPASQSTPDHFKREKGGSETLSSSGRRPWKIQNASYFLGVGNKNVKKTPFL